MQDCVTKIRANLHRTGPLWVASSFLSRFEMKLRIDFGIPLSDLYRQEAKLWLTQTLSLSSSEPQAQEWFFALCETSQLPFSIVTEYHFKLLQLLF